MNYRGRKRIYTDVTKITEQNIVQVLRDSFIVHEQNREEMLALIKFDKGEQPLQRPKIIRPEIDIQAIANLANEITEFNLGYFWGNPVSIVQKSEKLPKGSDPKRDNEAITKLNEFYYAEDKDSKDQEMARFVEICGLGYQMIDIKRDYEEGDSPFDLIVLNPLYTFIVYSSDIKHEPLLGVTYTVDRLGNKKQFTCISKDNVFIVTASYRLGRNKQPVYDKNGKEIVDYSFTDESGLKNPFVEVNIGECDRSFDYMGCFERQIDDLNAYNIMQSDLVNDISQTTQAIWWGNNVEFETDENGDPIPPVGGQWVLTKTNVHSSTSADIKPLSIVYDYSGVIQNIQTKHDEILERAFVPKQSDPGGGSTGSAMSLSSGWSAAEAAACKKSQVVRKFFQWRNRMAIKACKISALAPQNGVEELSPNDVDVRFVRQKTFDLATKVNSLATMLNCMVDPKTAMATVDLFGNLAEAIDDSLDNMKRYQEKLLKDSQQAEGNAAESAQNGTEQPENGGTEVFTRTMSDSSDQTDNSPVQQMVG